MTDCDGPSRAVPVPSLDAGLLWVEARIRALAEELGWPVDAFE